MHNARSPFPSSSPTTTITITVLSLRLEDHTIDYESQMTGFAKKEKKKKKRIF